MIMAIWVYFNADTYYVKAPYTLIFVVLTIILGPIGLALYR